MVMNLAPNATQIVLAFVMTLRSFMWCLSDAAVQCCKTFTTPPCIQRSHMLLHVTRRLSSNSSNNGNSSSSNTCQRKQGGCEATLASSATHSLI